MKNILQYEGCLHTTDIIQHIVECRQIMTGRAERWQPVSWSHSFDVFCHFYLSILKLFHVQSALSCTFLCLQTVSGVIAVGTSHGLALVFGKSKL